MTLILILAALLVSASVFVWSLCRVAANADKATTEALKREREREV